MAVFSQALSAGRRHQHRPVPYATIRSAPIDYRSPIRQSLGSLNENKGGKMNNPPTGLFEEEWKRALPSMAFNIVIVYETAQDEMQAKRFSDQVADEVANGRELTRTMNVWNFQALRIPRIRNAAAIAAAAADIIIISVTETKALPAQVRDLIRLSSRLVNHSHPFVVALFANPVDENAPIRAELRRTALRKGLDFFTQTGRRAAGMHHYKKFSTRGARMVEGEKRSLRQARRLRHRKMKA